MPAPSKILAPSGTLDAILATVAVNDAARVNAAAQMYAPGAKTATPAVAPQTNLYSGALTAYLSITATPNNAETLTLTVQRIDPMLGTVINALVSCLPILASDLGAAPTTAGQFRIHVGPDAPALASVVEAAATAGAASAVVLAKRRERSSALIMNVGTTDAYVSMSGTAVVGTCALVKAGGWIRVPEGYHGDVAAIRAGGTDASLVTIEERYATGVEFFRTRLPRTWQAQIAHSSTGSWNYAFDCETTLR